MMGDPRGLCAVLGRILGGRSGRGIFAWSEVEKGSFGPLYGAGGILSFGREWAGVVGVGIGDGDGDKWRSWR